MFVLFLYCFVRHFERFDSLQLGLPLPDDRAEALGALPVALVVTRDLENAILLYCFSLICHRVTHPNDKNLQLT